MYSRKEESAVRRYVSFFPVTAILGPRQCGKTTLAKKIAKEMPNSLYLDMEKASDYKKITDPELFFRSNLGKLIVIDEIQVRKDIFPAIRSFVDSAEEKTPILVLGSASPELIRQSSETLAGRIAFCELAPLSCIEAGDAQLHDIWFKGGFPHSLLAPELELSNEWREFFIKTFVERDLPLLGLRLAPIQINRLFSLLAHSHGDLLNSSKLGEALGVSHTMFRQYADFLEGSFLIRTLSPNFSNQKKRIVKSPKVYIRDSGILHSILGIRSFNDLLGHPSVGCSWEGFAIEQILNSISKDWTPSFYRTQAGAEMDLVLENGRERIGIEFKANTAPTVSAGFWNSINDLELGKAYIVCPIEDSYLYKENVEICGVRECVAKIRFCEALD
jgi:predicted AAA+ superfamily ATPase